MFSLRSAFQTLSSPLRLFRMSPVSSVQSSELHSSNTSASSKVGSLWRLPRYEGGTRSIWPNYKESYIHRKHRIHQIWHTWGVMKTTKMNVVDNSALGRKAMAEGRPPKVIHVYARKHYKKAHGNYGKLGDRVLVAILGQMKKGIIVGVKNKQRHAIPKYDSNNIVLIEDNGNPTGNRITAPLPNVIRPILQKDSNPKKADYTKLFAIGTRWI